ncbi:MAG: DNA replication and repair protein RecF, partial [Clostridia bacterium]
IKESPQERRRFMDISLSQQSKNYLYGLSQYNDILEQRNKLLKTTRDKAKLEQMLFAWDSQLAKYGALIVAARYEFVEHLAKIAVEIHGRLTDNKEQLEIKYESKITLDTQENMQKQIAEKLQASLDKDINLQYTSVGAHRDDIAILVSGIDARKFGSQGQQRTATLSLKLAEIGLFKQQLGETPILLLDDVLSELDENRRAQLMELASGMQTIITCTDFDINIDHNEIKVDNGKIEKNNKVQKSL